MKFGGGIVDAKFAAVAPPIPAAPTPAAAAPAPIPAAPTPAPTPAAAAPAPPAVKAAAAATPNNAATQGMTIPHIAPVDKPLLLFLG